MSLRIASAFTVVVMWAGLGCSREDHPRVELIEKPADAGTHSSHAHDASAAADSGAEMDAGASAPAGTTTAENFADAWARAERDHITRCCHGVGMGGPSRAVPSPLPSARSGARFDESAAEQCVEETASLPCELQKQAHPVAPSCASAFSRGSVAIGEPCTSEFECAQAKDEITSCIERYVDKKLVPRCTAVRVAAAGDPCLSDETDEWIACTSPLLCDQDRNVCTKPAKLGEPCITGPSQGDTCEPGAVCDRQDTHTCVRPKPSGEGCTMPEECEALACIDGRCVTPLFALPLCGK